VTLEYKGDVDSEEYVCLVGKGITFDTGGVSLKSDMDNMNLDKCGAVNVLASIKFASENKLKVNLYCAVFFAENAIGNES